MANRVLDECHLQNITVAKDYRRQGLGQFMMDILIKRMRLADLNSVLLEVRKSNHAAQSFYEKLDFERLSERKDYYKTDNGKENAIIMHRILR
jgi:ribosomal-protein-alanine N-acetyltransferase